MPEPIDQPPTADRYEFRALVHRLLMEYGRANLKRYTKAFALMAIAAASTALTAYLIGDVINQAFLHRNFTTIYLLGGAIIVLFTAKGLATYGHAVILARISNHIIADNQRRLCEKLLNERLAFFSDRHSSEFVARLNFGAAAASQVLGLLVTAVGRDLLSLIGLVTVMVVQDPMLSLVGLVVLPPTIFVVLRLVQRVRAVVKRQFASSARVLETMQEAVQGIRIVKAFTLEEEMQRRMAANIADVEQAANKMARISNRANPLMETLAGIAIALGLLYGCYTAIETGTVPGAFVSFIAAFILAYEPAKRLARLHIDLNAALTGVRILFELIDSPASEPIEDSRPPIAVKSGRIEFSSARFEYRPDEPVIRGMSFVAEPGKVTALVGPSGGGKSTVLALILRLYDLDGGTITIDGQDISRVSRRSLRRQLAYVGQNVFLFRATIRENIAVGKPDATEAEIVAAAKAANAHDFIMSFPSGYDTPVGEHGTQLSGGQRQRVAIARALIRNAPITLLDEATASLDSESERQVQDAIAHLCEGHTTLVVAHRMHTIVHADRILVVEDGVIVESGRHEELLRRGGRYASFFRLQLRDHALPREPIAVASG